VISAEEVFELSFSHPDWVPLQTRQAGLEGTGEVRLRDLVKESLRMRPSRVIVGEVRAEECLDLLLALNAGLPGMASLHANSGREALVKLCTLPLLAGDAYPVRFRRESARNPCWSRDSYGLNHPNAPREQRPPIGGYDAPSAPRGSRHGTGRLGSPGRASPVRTPLPRPGLSTRPVRFRPRQAP
jgi:hypothetical protein